MQRSSLNLTGQSVGGWNVVFIGVWLNTVQQLACVGTWGSATAAGCFIISTSCLTCSERVLATLLLQMEKVTYHPLGEQAFSESQDDLRQRRPIPFPFRRKSTWIWLLSSLCILLAVSDVIFVVILLHKDSSSIFTDDSKYCKYTISLLSSLRRN